jgi:hypothetical protein
MAGKSVVTVLPFVVGGRKAELTRALRQSYSCLAFEAFPSSVFAHADCQYWHGVVMLNQSGH